MDLVTGTPGWMGTRLVRKLVEAGRRVRCLILPGTDGGSLSALGADVRVGDITRPDTLAGVCDGVETVYHCAGMIHPKHPSEFFTVNKQGALNLMNEAVRSAARRFVYVSTNAATHADHGLFEATETNPIHPLFQYGRSKLEAEQALHALGKTTGVETVVIRPNWLYGLQGAGRQTQFLRLVERGHAWCWGPLTNRHSLLDIDNCVQALLLAGSVPRAVGQTYFIADASPYGLPDTYRLLGRMLGRSVRPRRVPFPAQATLVYPWFNLAMQKVRFYRPDFHIAWEWSKNVVCSIAKAQAELGYRPLNDFSSSMEREVRRLRDAGELGRRA